jgi:ubiquinone/menaquinone biosynthesis C-methylase UbiE
MEHDHMNSEDKRLDFSKGRYREMLEWQRRRMWSDEAIERLANWIGLHHGMSLLDVGCGLGYLGYTFWNHFGKNGHYTGVDIRLKLIEEAIETSEKWAHGGSVDFIEADVYELPFDDNSFDWVACQTLMIHLAQPEAALHEMVRVLKPGGIITCFEPDNLRPTLIRAASSLPPLDLEQQLLGYRVNYIANQGRIKLGRGDAGIAPSLPHLMTLAGVKDIDIRVRDTVSFMEPPYETERQREAVTNMKTHWVDEESYQARMQQHREEFLAGGGDPDDFEEMTKAGEQLREIQSRQLEESTFFICGAYPLYVIKGRKPAQ